MDTPQNMKSPRLQMVLFAGLYLIFLGCLVFSSSYLPEHIATHFGVDGQPNGWMSRPSLLLSSAVFGFAFPLLVVAICWVGRFAPNLLNVPHKEHWLAAEHRQNTFDYLFSHSWWFACLEMCFLMGMYVLLVFSNHQVPPHLSNSAVLILTGIFLVGLTVWIVTLLQYFNRVT